MEKEKIMEMAEKLGIRYEDILRANFQNTEIISSVMLSHIKDLVVTIRPDGIQFNNSCLKLFDETDYILMGIDRPQKWFVVNACDRDDISSQRWCRTTKEGKREARKISCKIYTDRIYKFMKWNKGYYYTLFGTLSLEENVEDEPYLIFDMSSFRQVPLTEKGRAAAGVSDIEIGAEELAKIKQEEETARLEKEDAVKRGERPRRRRRIEIGGLEDENSMGVPRKKYKRRLKLSNLDEIENINQMSFDDLVPAEN